MTTTTIQTQKAILLDLQCRKHAQTDTDFDPIRHAPAFQSLIAESQEDN